MPIYLVRWPDLTASLVRARDADDLLYILDQVANPEGCEWSVYGEPLFIDFRLPAEWSIRDRRPVKPVTPDQVVVEDIGPMANEQIVDVLDISLAEGDDGQDMGEAVLKKAFPILQAAIEKLQSSDEAEAREFILPEADLREALHAELVRMLKASWRKAQVARGTDPASMLAQYTDLPVRLAQKLTDGVLEELQGEDDAPSPRGNGTMSSPPFAGEAVEGGRLFSVSNHHVAGCGEPPLVDGGQPGFYFGYFANEHGEQAIYAYNHETGEATLRMGDAGWGDGYRVVDGEVEELLLTGAERAWLLACWLASGGLDQARSQAGSDGGEPDPLEQ